MVHNHNHTMVYHTYPGPYQIVNTEWPFSNDIITIQIISTNSRSWCTYTYQTVFSNNILNIQIIGYHMAYTIRCV